MFTQIIVGTACAFVGLTLLSIPVWLSQPEPTPLTWRSLAEFLFIILMISLSLSALAV